MTRQLVQTLSKAPLPTGGRDALRTARAREHATDTQPVAELRSATKRYGDVLALDAVSLQVRPGEVLAILGPNGAGKTTAVSLLLGLLRPTSGTATLFGSNPTDMAAKVNVGAMLQVSGVPATLTVREHLQSFANYYPDPMPVDEAIERTSLNEVADRLYGKLSGGQRQRLHFALAMVGNPKLLFLDEPTTGLDVESRRHFWRQVRGFLSGGRTVVLTTHHLDEADALSDRVIVMDRGRILAEGTPAAIKSRTAGRRVRAVTDLSDAELRALPGVVSLERVGASVELLSAAAEATVGALLASGREVSDLQVTDVGLEEAFLALTRNGGTTPPDATNTAIETGAAV